MKNITLNLNVDRRQLTEECCYQKLYGDLIECVPHYKKRSFFRVIKSPSKIYVSIFGAGGDGRGYGRGGGIGHDGPIGPGEFKSVSSTCSYCGSMNYMHNSSCPTLGKSNSTGESGADGDGKHVL